MVYWNSPISTAPLDATIDLMCPGRVRPNHQQMGARPISPPSYTTLGEWANHENDILVAVIFHSAIPGWWLHLGGNAIQKDVDVKLSNREGIIALLKG
jgi:hypothetical protein